MANRFNVRLPLNEDPAIKAVELAHVKEIAATDWEKEVAGAALPVVLDFYGTDSKPCEVFAPRFAAVAEKFAGKARFLKVQRAANAELATRLGVTASPTVVFLQAGKEQGERLSGEDIKRTALKAGVEAMLGIAPVAAAVAPAR